jgi:hypothetical protein
MKDSNYKPDITLLDRWYLDWLGYDHYVCRKPATREVTIPAPACAGINYGRYPSSQPEWIPAFAGMTSKKCKPSDMMIFMKLLLIQS